MKPTAQVVQVVVELQVRQLAGQAVQVLFGGRKNPEVQPQVPLMTVNKSVVSQVVHTWRVEQAVQPNSVELQAIHAVPLSPNPGLQPQTFPRRT